MTQTRRRADAGDRKPGHRKPGGSREASRDKGRIIVYILAGLIMAVILYMAIAGIDSAEQIREREAIGKARAAARQMRAAGEIKDARGLEEVIQEYVNAYVKRYGKQP